MFKVLIVLGQPERAEKIIYDGHASSVCLPGADGEFEILDFHKPIISHLKEGVILVDNEQEFQIRGGVVKMGGQSLVAMVEL